MPGSAGPATGAVTAEQATRATPDPGGAADAPELACRLLSAGSMGKSMGGRSVSSLSAAWALDGARQGATERAFHRYLLEALQASVGCDGACIRPGTRWPDSAPCYLDEDTRFTDGYVRDADRYRPGIARWCKLSRGEAAFIDTEVFSTAERRRILLYDEVVTPAGVRSIMGCPLRHGGAVVGLILLFRRGSVRPFPAELAHAVTRQLPGIALAELAMLRTVSRIGQARAPEDDHRTTAPRRALDPVAPALPARHARVLDALLTGDSEKQIAAALSLSPRTIHKYTEQVFRALRVRSRPELMARFVHR